MISCKHCEDLINARLDEYLTPEDALLLEEHLAECPHCRKLDRDLTALHERLKALAFDPPADLSAAILSQLEFPTMSSKKTPWAAIACAAAAVVLMVVVLTPQFSPFGGSSADTAAAEGGEAPETVTMGSESAPAESAVQEEEKQTEAESEDLRIEPLSEGEALALLQDYLDQTGLSLELNPGALAEDGSFWTFTGRDPDSSDRFLFNIYCSDSFVEEVPLP